MKTFLQVVICLATCSYALQAQTGSVGIGTPTPNASAALDIEASNKGFLLPRIADPTTIASPATGLLVYNTTTNKFSYYNGTAWAEVGGSTLTAGTGLSISGTTINSVWTTTGNNIYNNNSGNVGIGASIPSYKLDVNGDANVSGNYRLGGVNAIFNNANDIYGNIRVLQNNSATLQDGMYVNYNSTGGANAHLRFYANGVNQRMFINANDGSVNITHLAGQSTNKPVLADANGTLFQGVNPAWQQGAEYCRNRDTHPGNNTHYDLTSIWGVTNANGFCFVNATGGQSGSLQEWAHVYLDGNGRWQFFFRSGNSTFTICARCFRLY